MTTTPYFTVGIPTYNRAHFLRECIANVLRQSFDDFELIVSDNASSDDTPAVVRGFDDPRLRSVRHDTNLGAYRNFVSLSEQAAGRFLVLNQDDDLLHRDFLRRCHDAVDGDDEIVIYATPKWFGDPAREMEARLLTDPASRTTEYALADRPLRLDGARMAVLFLLSFFITHPTIAIRTSTLKAIGGFYREDWSASDVITQARVLAQGMLAYDPRVGAVFRTHGENISRTWDSSMRSGVISRMLARLVQDYDEAGIDWRRILSEELGAAPAARRLQCLRRWVSHSAPPALVNLAWRLYREAQPSAPARLADLLLHMGPRNLLRFLATRRPGGDGTGG